ncbi:MAG: competence protein TfoX [Caulobacter sp.]|nr:competence protein TfoX [Caulobacter sp.]
MEEFLQDLFAPIGPVTVKRMFGGLGVWFDGMMFALVFGETVYLKADAETLPTFTAAGSEPFVYTQRKRDRQASLNYLSLPAGAEDDPAEASRWGRLAIEAALRARAAKGPKKQKARADIGPGPWDG